MALLLAAAGSARLGARPASAGARLAGAGMSLLGAAACDTPAKSAPAETGGS
jgi:hypothetical protein